MQVTKDMTVHETVKASPQLKDVFVEFGFKSITDPIKFSTVAKIMTIEAACKMKNVDMEAFLKALNEKTEKEV